MKQHLTPSTSVISPDRKNIPKLTSVKTIILMSSYRLAFLLQQEKRCSTLVQKLTEMPFWRTSWVCCNFTDRGFPSKTENSVPFQTACFLLPNCEGTYVPLTSTSTQTKHRGKAVIHRQQTLSASLGRYFLLGTNCLFLVTCNNKFPSIFSGSIAPRGSLWHCTSLSSTSVLLYGCNIRAFGVTLEPFQVSRSQTELVNYIGLIQELLTETEFFFLDCLKNWKMLLADHSANYYLYCGH